MEGAAAAAWTRDSPGGAQPGKQTCPDSGFAPGPSHKQGGSEASRGQSCRAPGGIGPLTFHLFGGRPPHWKHLNPEPACGCLTPHGALPFPSAQKRAFGNSLASGQMLPWASLSHCVALIRQRAWNCRQLPPLLPTAGLFRPWAPSLGRLWGAASGGQQGAVASGRAPASPWSLPQRLGVCGGWRGLLPQASRGAPPRPRPPRKT